MSNFGFVASEWPRIHVDCVRAEGYLASDPRSACFYARRSVEQLVGFVYDVERLQVPYRDDLAARIADPAFQRLIGVGIAQKLTLVRRVGNKAVHDTSPLSQKLALDVVRELHHVVVWTAQRYSTDPARVPVRATFDPQLARRQAPMTRAEVQQLAAKFRAQDEARARELQERDELSAEKDAEIARLRDQIEAAQAAHAVPDTRDYDEAGTRDLIIDELLREAGWPLSDARDREHRVEGMPTPGGVGYVDYVLWGADGLPLAVVEAKKTTVDPSAGQQQAKLYADCLEQMTGRRPVVLYTNGYSTWLWDDAAGYPPRQLQGFLTREELELMVQRRTTRVDPGGVEIDADIVERHYQQRAVRAVGEAFSARQRAALLVMATGSGKTRTVIALVDQLMRAGWVKRVLFLADRTALVNQAVASFKEHLPNAATVNLVTDRITDGRVFCSTYPTMLNLIETRDGAERLFGPGHFDLVVIDEAHRSVYQRYGAITEWFDALLVGLTATPKDEVDRNTYRLFDLEEGVPTDAYALEEAVAEGFLVPPVPVSVPTRFLREGIRYDDLPEAEKDAWDAMEWGGDGDEVPDAVAAEELNRFLFNADTVDKVLATLMTQGHKVASGDRIGKTIIFAKNEAHAQFVVERFDINYPELAGQVARKVTHSVTYAQNLIDDFSTPSKAPHIVVSVDMLDTGVDVPDVCNLVFFKLVRSKAKFWQMIGRGTRLRPDLFGPGRHKQNFYVFDFCGNLEFFSQDLSESSGSVQRSLLQRIFEARLGVVAALDELTGGEEDPEVGHGERTVRGVRVDAAWSLFETVSAMNVKNFLVRPHREWVDAWSDWGRWQRLTYEQAGDLAQHLAGLASATADGDEDAKRFDLMLLKLQLARLGDEAPVFERLAEQVRAIAGALLARTSIPSVRQQEQLLERVASEEWWVHADLPELELLRRRLRTLVGFVDRQQRALVYADFADEVGEGTLVDLPGLTPGVSWDRFRDKARAYLQAHEDHLALQRLRRNQQLTPDDLVALEAMLVDAGASDGDLVRAVEESQGLGLFIRSLVGLDRQAATSAFDDFIAGATLTVTQLRFVQLVVEQLTANGAMEVARLYESPFTDSAPHGPESLFADAQVDDLVGVLDRVRSHALADVTVA